jgi:hypothetical protein
MISSVVDLRINFLMDSGSSINAIDKQTFEKLKTRKSMLEKTTTYVVSTAASASALLIIWSFSISIAVRLQKITGNAKPRVYYC